VVSPTTTTVEDVSQHVPSGVVVVVVDDVDIEVVDVEELVVVSPPTTVDVVVVGIVDAVVEVVELVVEEVDVVDVDVVVVGAVELEVSPPNVVDVVVDDSVTGTVDVVVVELVGVVAVVDVELVDDEDELLAVDVVDDDGALLDDVVVVPEPPPQLVTLTFLSDVMLLATNWPERSVWSPRAKLPRSDKKWPAIWVFFENWIAVSLAPVAPSART
jgi:hypothetical protein